MDIKKLAGVNTKINNILQFPLPYWRSFEGESKPLNSWPEENKKNKMVVFFGNDMKGILGLGVANRGAYIRKCNECLDYVRRNFSDFKLFYKPHPGDEKEQSFLNLKDFNLIKDGVTAEIFLWQNINRIRAAFSILSFSAFNAYNMGLESHVFYRFFPDVLGQEFVRTFDEAYFEMPPSFYIEDLKQKPEDNSRILKEDKLLESNLKKILNKNTGRIWFFCSFSEHAVILAILANIIKDLLPGKPIGLIVSHHYRWDSIKDYLKNYFDEIIFMPRIFYSLRPGKLWKALKTARQIKNFKIMPNDLLIIASQPDFVENCFNSYHQNCLRIGIMLKRDFNTYNMQNWIYTGNSRFRFNKATWFFNKIFEPILGLNRCLYLAFTGMKGFYLNRYQRPINEVFNKLIIFHVT